MSTQCGHKTYFTADTHFGNEAIIRYENRPFENVRAMDEALIDNWNETVNPEDEVFVLGDFSSYGLNETKRICQRLQGHKVLVMGNHDVEAPKDYESCGFELVIPYPVIYDGFWMLSHEPVYVSRNMPYANLFGHVHNSPTYVDVTEQSFCVCVERTDYRPIEFTEIKRRMGLIK